MKSMNDMTMKELLEADRKINRHFWEESHFQKRKSPLPLDNCHLTEDLPEWAAAIEADTEYKERMGAYRCDDCGAIVKHDEFRCNNCAVLKAHRTELRRQQKQRDKTRRLFNG